MAKFKVGDRVKIVDKKYTSCKVGDIGTIKGIRFDSSGWLPYALELDYDIECGFHSCDGYTKANRGQWVNDGNIELIEPEFKLVVISRGDKTKAKLYRGESLEKKVEVNCYHKDEYSEKATVDAVVKKIFSEDENEDEKENEANKPYNGKAVWTSDNESVYTKGKIYEFVDGRIKHDLGFTIGGYTLANMKQFGCFLPIVE